MSMSALSELVIDVVVLDVVAGHGLHGTLGEAVPFVVEIRWSAKFLQVRCRCKRSLGSSHSTSVILAFFQPAGELVWLGHLMRGPPGVVERLLRTG